VDTGRTSGYELRVKSNRLVTFPFPNWAVILFEKYNMVGAKVRDCVTRARRRARSGTGIERALRCTVTGVESSGPTSCPHSSGPTSCPHSSGPTSCPHSSGGFMVSPMPVAADDADADTDDRSGATGPGRRSTRRRRENYLETVYSTDQ